MWKFPTWNQWLELSWYRRIGWVIFWFVVQSDFSAFWIEVYIWWQGLAG